MVATDNTALCSRSPPSRGVAATAPAVVERTLVFDDGAEEVVRCIACEGCDCSMNGVRPRGETTKMELEHGPVSCHD
jgi:hypothetical protein